VDSLHALVTGSTLIRPEVLIRLTKSFTVALPIWLATVPLGSEERSN
jgi:plasmid maintenance system antidote protein VapI